MKRVLILFLFTIFLGFPILKAAHAENTSPRIIIDNVEKKFISSPILNNDQVLVPFTEIFKSFGADVDWNTSNKCVTAVLTYDDLWQTKRVITIDYKNKNLILDKKVKKINHLKLTKRDVLIPVRLVKEILGYTVKWNRTTKTVSIYTGRGKTKKEYIEVHYINVGCGDAIYISLPKQNDILIDAGSSEYGSKVVNYLKNQGVDDIELLIASHPHQEHIGGIPAVLDAFDVLKIIDNGEESPNNTYKRYNYKAEREASIRQFHACQTINYPNAEIQILTQRLSYSDLDKESVVAKLDCGEVEFLFPGDIWGDALNNITDNLEAEVLKAPCHGKKIYLPDFLLEKVKPSVIVISNDNNEEELKFESLKNRGIRPLFTAETDVVVIKTDGNKIAIKNKKNLNTREQEQK